jgi:polysaccharide export outer membrane protein
MGQWGGTRPSRRAVLWGGLALGASGCSNITFPVSSPGQQDLPGRDITVIRVTGENIGLYREPANPPSSAEGRNPPPPVGRYAYRVGPGDTLEIVFYADPAGITEPGEVAPRSTAVVDENGRFFYPFVGNITATGRTVGEIRAILTAQLEQFFATPQVEVAVAEYNARTVTIVGEVGAPGRKTLTNVTTTLLDLISEAGANADADLSRIDLRRGGHTFEVNLLSYLENGEPRHNPVILPDDLVRVPLAADNKIFTFGEIRTGEIPLTTARKTLLEVLAEAGGFDRVRADARGIFVFRRDDPMRRGFDVYQFDLRNAAALVLAAEFEMAPLDIVFVTNDPATRWSDTLNKIVDPFDSLLDARTTAEVLSRN